VPSKKLIGFSWALCTSARAIFPGIRNRAFTSQAVTRQVTTSVPIASSMIDGRL
jgi:hypothetical protein